MRPKLACVLIVGAAVGCLSCDQERPEPAAEIGVFIGNDASSTGKLNLLIDGNLRALALTGTPVSQSALRGLLVVNGAIVTLVDVDGTVVDQYDLTDAFSTMIPPDDQKVIGSNTEVDRLYYVVTRREPATGLSTTSGMKYAEWTLFSYDTKTGQSKPLLDLPRLLSLGIKDLGLPTADYSSLNVLATSDWVYLSVPSSRVVTTSGYSTPLTLRLNPHNSSLERVGFGMIVAAFDDSVLLVEEHFDESGGASARILYADGREVQLGRVARICASQRYFALLPVESAFLEIREASDPLRIVYSIPVSSSYRLFGKGFGLVIEGGVIEGRTGGANEG